MEDLELAKTEKATDLSLTMDILEVIGRLNLLSTLSPDEQNKALCIFRDSTVNLLNHLGYLNEKLKESLPIPTNN